MPHKEKPEIIKKGYPPVKPPAKPSKEDRGFVPPKPPAKPKEQPSK